MDDYRKMYEKSVNPETAEAFWGEQATRFIDWIRPFDTVRMGGFEVGDHAWFVGGQMNVSSSCLDKHLPKLASKPAIVWEADEPGTCETLTYLDVLHGTCRIANALKVTGAAKGDFVTIYMPMMPDTAMAMLACTRIGAPHTVVFAGFTASSLRDRILDSQSKWVLTSDVGKRGSKTIKLKEITDAAVSQCPKVQKIFVFKRTGEEVPTNRDVDVHMDELLPKMRPYCPPTPVAAEDTLFTLYTSGSTGKPKGVAHAAAGYLLQAAMTCLYSFDLRETDVFACVADVGWITGHSYIVYGPLCNGATTVMFESVPTYPDPGRYWDLVDRHGVTVFYTAPTAIRALMAHGEAPVKKYSRASLRILGTVGEPINPEAWRWYYEVVGDKRCSIVDTYWQTETGGHVMTPLPGVTPMKPGSCCLPFFGVVPKVLDSQTGAELRETAVDGVLAFGQSWPGACRTVWGDHERYMNTYLLPYPPNYFTGDGCRRDEDGYFWIMGRIDDVLNTSGHRIGTAEVESALVAHQAVAQAATVGYPHDIKGQGICCYLELTKGYEESPELIKELKGAVRSAIGPFATPDLIIAVPLPKTRSGKIMRRILRKVAAGEESQLGDVTTLADPTVVDALITKVKKVQGRP
ncbi:hypothetical protein CTAYLR_007379 [Chrysophaeum taylorii]|uniref:Acetyl-coenzyme A synthetase n=1 Tax=Chrysophaeum taylorii TaxID=2483200 RepID=A0AAD7U4F4_9STRA|nr:hypothetical protein CTAYLR_007379 [Chrysophaeum taylorii]